MRKQSAKIMLRPKVRFGSKGDIGWRPDHVCFTPKNGHRRSRMQCLFRANSGHVTVMPVAQLELTLFVKRLLFEGAAASAGMGSGKGPVRTSSVKEPDPHQPPRVGLLF
jgi:hypothetical protein